MTSPALLRRSADLVGGGGEAFTAWRRRLPNFGEELADVALYLMAVARMNGIDLDGEIEHKITKNAARVYRRDSHGIPVRIAEGAGG